MKLQVLHVPGCPNTPVLVARLRDVLAGRRDVLVEEHVITDEAQAAAWGMTGSPTLLVDGVDPFRVAGTAPSLSCRLYRDADRDGDLSRGADGAPSIAALRTALEGGSEAADAGR